MNTATTNEAPQQAWQAALGALQPVTRDYFMNGADASKLTGYSLDWLERKRWSGGGPDFVKADGGQVRYQYSDLMQYMVSRKKSSTAQYQPHQKPPGNTRGRLGKGKPTTAHN
jgi:hypothetical protein